MARFLIEVPHGADKSSCEEAIRVFLQTGSHFLTHAEWGCKDNDHKAWLIVELESKQDALGVLPSTYRHDAKVVELTRFTVEAAESMKEEHPT